MPLSDLRLPALLDSRPPCPEDLLLWLLTASPEEGKPSSIRTDRLQTLHQALASRGLLDSVAQAWAHASAVRLLAETGLPDQTSLFGEGFQRLVDHVIPRMDPEGDLYALLNRLGLDAEDARWVASLPAETCAAWAPIITPPQHAWAHAARLLAHRAAALGLSRDMLALAPGDQDLDSPFAELPGRVRNLAGAPHDPVAQAAWKDCLGACRTRLRTAHAAMDERGVSSDLVFRMELLDAQLARMERLLAFTQGHGDGRAFAAELVRGSAEQRSLRALLRRSLKRLLQKIVEHSGETGEHYIARNRQEWWHMATSAAGGGLVTAGTALLKYAFSALPFAPLMMGLALAGNYAGSFCFMQVLGFSLASKQPAMTAAALAHALEEERGLEAEVDLVAAITRTQTIATLGNVLVAIPASLVVVVIWILVTGHGPLSATTAAHSLHANHPFHGWTLFYAAITGVLLWASSVASGWAANWSAYRRLPEAIATSHRLKAWLGSALAASVSRGVRKHLAAFAGYAVLGFLLGFVPLLAAFTGIHLEVRHVTLQSASLALAAGSLWGQGPLPWGDIGWGLLGVGLIGGANFGVSFGLSLWSAIQARDLDIRSTFQLMLRIVYAFVRAPGRFLWMPPRTACTERETS